MIFLLVLYKHLGLSSQIVVELGQPPNVHRHLALGHTMRLSIGIGELIIIMIVTVRQVGVNSVKLGKNIVQELEMLHILELTLSHVQAL